MKVIALINYRDIKTGMCYNAGQRIEYADDRAAELAEKGFVKPEKAVTIPKTEKKAAATKKATASKKK